MPGFYRFLFGFVPFILAFFAGILFVTEVSAAMLVIVWIASAWLLFSTDHAELGAFVGILAVFVAGCATAGLALAYAFVYGFHLPLSWVFRPGIF